jgi:hypothetical protein
MVLDEAPVPMDLAVFVPRVTAQEHRAGTLPLMITEGKRVGLHFRRFEAHGRGNSARINRAIFEKT